MNTPIRYTDDDVAALYEALNPWGPAEDFYLPYVMDSRAVLDVGCGSGMLLRRARELGHTGRLTGIDPDSAALSRARMRADIEWVEGRADQIPWIGEFDLVVMTGHAFQCLLTDDAITSSLKAIRGAIRTGGLFVFETRNPANRAWELWAAAEPHVVTDQAGRTVQVSYDVEIVEGELITFSEITCDENGHVLRSDRATLRFHTEGGIGGRLGAAGFPVGIDFGDWDRSPVNPTSREIIWILSAD